MEKDVTSNKELNTEENAKANIDDQASNVDEKIQTIVHKDSALTRLDKSFNKHIELLEFKKSNILAYWIKQFSEYHDNEKNFKDLVLPTLKTFKRGDIVKANLGFNIGNELGGLHYCVVLNKNDNPFSGVLNIIPLSSSKTDKTYNTQTCIDIGDELFISLTTKFNKESEKLEKKLDDFQNLTIGEKSISQIEKINEVQVLLKRLDYLQKINTEISRMKHGSIAYVNQITTISKQRIFKTPILSGIKLSNASLDLLDNKIIELFTK